MQVLVMAAVAASAIGVDVGWEKTDDGQVEYIIQIEPHQLKTLKKGDVIDVGVRPELRNVRRYRIVIGDDQLPRETSVPAFVPNSSNSAAMPVDEDTGFSVVAPKRNETAPAQWQESEQAAANDNSAHFSSRDSIPPNPQTATDTLRADPSGRYSNSERHLDAQNDYGRNATERYADRDATQPELNPPANDPGPVRLLTPPDYRGDTASDDAAIPNRNGVYDRSTGGPIPSQLDRTDDPLRRFPSNSDAESDTGYSNRPHAAGPSMQPAMPILEQSQPAVPAQPATSGSPSTLGASPRGPAERVRSESADDLNAPLIGSRYAAPTAATFSQPPATASVESRSVETKPNARNSRASAEKPTADDETDSDGNTTTDSESEERPWALFTATLFALFASLGGNFYLGWMNWDMRQRFRSFARRLRLGDDRASTSRDERF